MARRMDWEGQRFRKIAGPLISKGMAKDFRRQAMQIAERVKKGHRSPQVHLHGQVRVLSEEEKAAYAVKMGWTVKAPAKEPTGASEKLESDCVPWWSEAEWAAGKRGLECKTVDSIEQSNGAGQEPSKKGCSK